MSTNNSKTTSLEEWKENMRLYGRQYAIMQDIMRLGFLKLSPEEMKIMEEAVKQQQLLYTEVRKIDAALRKLPDVEEILKKIRIARIERVRKERAARKIRKAEEQKAKQKQQKAQRLKTPFYLGEGVSAGLKFDESQTDKLQALGLPELKDASDLAALSGLNEGQWSWLCYHRKAAGIDHYQRFRIPKRSGGVRLISAPKPLLRKAQEFVLDQILEKIPLHEAAMAFRAKRSIVDNAQLHQQNQTIIKMDLKDFFPSIKFRRVKGLFQSFGYNEGIASMLALVCTDSARAEAKVRDKVYHVALSERYLPQGACTSPALTNIICKRMDARLQGLCEKMGFTYSRYADDMVFSHPDPEVQTGRLIQWIQKIIKDESFELHPDKLKVMRPHQRQAVTGVVINEQVAISRKDLRNFRSFLHHYEMEGAEAMSAKLGRNAENYAQGYWAFIHMVNPEQAGRLLEKHPWLKGKA